MKYRKKIFVNASTVLISGGLILTQNIIETLIKEDIFELIIICPSYKKYHFFETNHSVIRVVPKLLLKRINRVFLDYMWVPWIIHKTNPVLVFSLGNLPSITRYPQIYLHDNPYLTEQKIQGFSISLFTKLIHFLRKKETISRMKYVKHILVQTEYQAMKLKSILKNRPITILPPSLPIFQNSVSNVLFDEIFQENKIRIVCLSHYYEHKNLEKLIEVAILIKQKQLPFAIYITTSLKQHKNVKKLLSAIKANSIENVIINLGPIYHNNVAELIKKADAIILPSLLESFSIVFIETWKFNKPLFVSDIESIKSACKEAAFYFNPYSAESILNTLENAFNNPDQISGIIRKGNIRLSELPDWKEYATIIDKFSL